MHVLQFYMTMNHTTVSYYLTELYPGTAALPVTAGRCCTRGWLAVEAKKIVTAQSEMHFIFSFYKLARNNYLNPAECSYFGRCEHHHLKLKSFRPTGSDVRS